MPNLNWWFEGASPEGASRNRPIPRMDGSDSGGNPDGETPRPNAAVLARGDNFANALQVYGQGAKDMVGNIGGPIGATSGAMGFAQEMIDLKSRLARIDSAVAQGPRRSGRTLAEIEAAMRADAQQNQYDIQNTSLRLDEEKDDANIITVASEALTTAIGINKGLRAITKGAGDEEMPYDTDKYNELFKVKVEAARENGLDSLTPTERLKELDRINIEALEEASGKKLDTNNPFLKTADKIASALESIPGLGALRKKNIAAAREARMAQAFRLTPEHAKVLKEVNEKFYAESIELYGKNSPATDMSYEHYLNSLERTLALRYQIRQGDFLGSAGPGVDSWFSPLGPQDAPNLSPVTVDQATGATSYGFDGNVLAPLFEKIADGENKGFSNPFEAYNRGASGDSIQVVMNPDGTPKIVPTGRKNPDGTPQMREVKRRVEAQEIFGKPLTSMTVGEVYGYLSADRSEQMRLGASGYFQITKDAMDDAIKEKIVSPDDPYDQNTQVKLGVWTVTDKRPQIKAYLEAENPTREQLFAAQQALSLEYESFEDPETGLSHYGGPARVSAKDAAVALEQSRILVQADRRRGRSVINSFDGVMDREARFIFDTLSPHKDKDFVRRILYPKSSPVINAKDSAGRNVTITHRMSYGEIDVDGKKKYAVYPEIMPEEATREPGRSRMSSPEDRPALVDYSGDRSPEGRKAAFNEAMRRGEYIVFDDEDEAAWISENYKRLWGRR